MKIPSYLRSRISADAVVHMLFGKSEAEATRLAIDEAVKSTNYKIKPSALGKLSTKPTKGGGASAQVRDAAERVIASLCRPYKGLADYFTSSEPSAASTPPTIRKAKPQRGSHSPVGGPIGKPVTQEDTGHLDQGLIYSSGSSRLSGVQCNSEFGVGGRWGDDSATATWRRENGRG